MTLSEKLEKASTNPSLDAPPPPVQTATLRTMQPKLNLRQIDGHAETTPAPETERGAHVFLFRICTYGPLG